MNDRIKLSLFFVALVVATGSIGTNGAIPSAVGIEAEFQLMKGVGANIIGVFAFGYAIGHFAIGLTADHIDRKKLLSLSLAGFSIASLIAGLAQSQDMLLVSRFVQGLFASACPIIGRSIIRNAGTFEESAKTMSSASAIFAWAPVIAPVIAGILADSIGWRTVYFALSTYGICAFLAVNRANSQWFEMPAGTRPLSKRVVELTSNSAFWCGVISAMLMFGGFFLCLALTSDLVSDNSSRVARISVLVTALSAAYAVGGGLSRVLLHRFKSEKVLLISVLFSLLVGPSILLLHAYDYVLFSGMLFFALFAGTAMPNATILAMRNDAASSSMSAAVVGGSKMLMAAIVAGFAARVDAEPSVLLATTLLAITVVALPGVFWVQRR